MKRLWRLMWTLLVMLAADIISGLLILGAGHTHAQGVLVGWSFAIISILGMTCLIGIIVGETYE
jgi:hypothetical protein